MPNAPYLLVGTRNYQVWNGLDVATEHPHYSGYPDHTADNAPVLTDDYGNVIISENDTVTPIKTNLPLKAGDPVANEDVVTKGWVQASAGFLTQDGSTPLTGDWDIGVGRLIKTEKLLARDNILGLTLGSEDGTLGVFVEDGGQVGIGHNSPDHALDVSGDFQVTGDCDLDADVTVAGELAGALYSFVLSNAAGGDVDTTGIYLKAGEIPMTASKGLVARKNGSVVGVTIQYDITTSATDIEIQVHVNGASVWGNALNDTVASNVSAQFTALRSDGYDFTSGDIITVIVIAPSGSAPWTVIDDMIVTLDLVYD